MGRVSSDREITIIIAYSHAKHTRSARANWRGDAPAASTRLARRHLKNLEGGTSISPEIPK